MEGTEAMAIQFSSLDVMDEIHSELPEPIIQHILSFITCIKDLVRTSIISKTWLQAYRTYPNLSFNLDEFVSRSSNLSGKEIEAKRNQFIGFVENRLQEFRRQNGGDGNGNMMKIFELRTVNQMAHREITRWVGMALDCKIEHLNIVNITEKNWLGLPKDYSLLLPCMIPERVVSSNWLKCLVLVGPKIYIPLTESSHVDLPSLVILNIQYIDVMDEQLRKLLRGCPALEYIALLECDSLNKVAIFDNPKLETLQVTARTAKANLAAIEVKAPMLESFGYTAVCMDRPGFVRHDVVVKIHNSPKLKTLLIRDGNKTDEWFHKFIAQFPLMENLKIDGCDGLGKIRISNPLLKDLCIMNCFLEDVVISSKKLASFFFFTHPFSMLHTSIRMKLDNPLKNCTAQICLPALIRCNLMMEASWYSKLKEFLTRHVTFKSLVISVQGLASPDGDMNGKNVHKKLPHAACNIEKLQLDVNAPSSRQSHILNGLLSACHPTILVVISGNPFVKVVCKELDIKKNKRKSCCRDGFKCWKHQLKGVKIVKINGIKLEKGFDWDGLFDLLPTLKAGNDIFFKLTW